MLIDYHASMPTSMPAGVWEVLGLVAQFPIKLNANTMMPASTRVDFPNFRVVLACTSNSVLTEMKVSIRTLDRGR